MLYQIISFLLDVAASVVAGACLLRVYMQRLQLPFGNPVGQAVLALSDWLVLPLRRLLAPRGRWDLASLLAAVLAQAVEYLVLMLWLGAGLGGLVFLVLFSTVRVAILGLIGLIILHAVLSWVPNHSPIAGMVARLAEPLLAPLRRVLPQPQGLDFSPLVALLILQVLLIVLGNLQAASFL
ncbi:YggT family protein [Comamonas flocculans]|uniref:YggT family protein n=1 Tax=Comamonas flocculans TaxID=2597701 RepID=A0A5B8RZY3_9BURK|nr:YggT family protein [Comamonas flocculans]QEA14448.1 YggT family protein [Comamonas flocculans]